MYPKISLPALLALLPITTGLIFGLSACGGGGGGDRGSHDSTPTSIYFSGNDGSAGVELWKTDGTEAGTVLVKDINAGSGDSSPSLFTVLNGETYFQASDGADGMELWKTDGTAAGTSPMRSFATACRA